MACGRILLLTLAGVWLVACTDGGGDGRVDDTQPPELGEEGVLPVDEDAPYADALGQHDPTRAACSTETTPHALAPADSRDFSTASLALAEMLRGSWPGAPSSTELLAFLGPYRGPEGGRFIGHMTASRLDAFYLAPPALKPVHVIAILDLGPSIRAEVPLVTGALEALASRVATSGLNDVLSVVEWTEEATVGIRLASPNDAVARIASFNEALRSRVQFGGNPPMTVVREGVRSLVSEGEVPAHIVLMTDGSMSAKDSSTLDTIAAWRQSGATISLLEVQAFDPQDAPDALPIHTALLDDRRVADAGYYLAAAVVGDPTRPPARSLDAAYRWPMDYLLSDRFDDLFRPSGVRGRFEVSAPEAVGLTPMLVGDTDEGQTGLRRLGSAGVTFTQASVTTELCSSFEGKLRLLGQSVTSEPEAEIAAGSVVFGGAGLPAYDALFSAIDEIERALGAGTCEAAAIDEVEAALAATSTEALDQAEAAAFLVSRDRTLLALEALKTLCN